MDIEQIFIAANQALAAGSYKEFLIYCSDDIRWERVGEKILNGKVELLEYIGPAYDGLTFTTERYIRQENFLVELGEIVFDKNGESKKSSYCDIWNFRDGLIHQVKSFVI